MPISPYHTREKNATQHPGHLLKPPATQRISAQKQVDDKKLVDAIAKKAAILKQGLQCVTDIKNYMEGTTVRGKLTADATPAKGSSLTIDSEGKEADMRCSPTNSIVVSSMKKKSKDSNKLLHEVIDESYNLQVFKGAAMQTQEAVPPSSLKRKVCEAGYISSSDLEEPEGKKGDDEDYKLEGSDAMDIEVQVSAMWLAPGVLSDGLHKTNVTSVTITESPAKKVKVWEGEYHYMRIFRTELGNCHKKTHSIIWQTNTSSNDFYH
ncbi:hypothetical protein PAXRUDRAFT_15544 [Paxillus rubicundulus Ve08.2h10]|uniref:Uncharacterized protein n=1 Tax=Paxillus rubicundulus Ve08.2h10 TaxID=930991 RepID=A0A0D0DAD5_9AGAM|nr:hypothetical protein PAXRUDRAFT_15544 [Paxillus rubicundulus Ve08.2h10]